LCKDIEQNQIKKECVFCNHLKMAQYEYNNSTYNKLIFPYSRYEYWYCTLNLEPLELGHSMIIYRGIKAHWLIDFEKLETDEWLELKKVIRDCKGKMYDFLLKNNKPPRTIYFIMLSETEPHHLHFHLIPNYLDKNELESKYKCKYHKLLKLVNGLLVLNKEEDYLDACTYHNTIDEIKINFGHWYLGLLEMKKNLIKYCKCNKENKEKLHLAAQQMEIFDKMDYLCS
jgi:diadenosine tetraphosphate (Ap4A) HIT family hydrolase